jgi:hypothetical protein
MAVAAFDHMLCAIRQVGGKTIFLAHGVLVWLWKACCQVRARRSVPAKSGAKGQISVSWCGHPPACERSDYPWWICSGRIKKRDPGTGGGPGSVRRMGEGLGGWGTPPGALVQHASICAVPAPVKFFWFPWAKSGGTVAQAGKPSHHDFAHPAEFPRQSIYSSYSAEISAPV